METARRADVDPARGLDDAQVAERVARGEVNDVPVAPTRTVAQIVRANVFTRFNALLGAMLVLILLVGPIQDEFDRELPMIIRRNDGRLLVDALCPVDDLKEACGLVLPEVSSDTTGGLIIELLGHIPQAGEKLNIGRCELTVIEAEATRVRRVEVRELEPEPGEGGEPSPKDADEPRQSEPESAEPSGRTA